MTHDYKRHGTTTLFAALDVLDGTVIGRNMQRHRHQEFMRFLNAIEAEVPAGKMVHVILDNYAAHKHPKVRAWLDRHERFVFHFTPTSCSWLNAVEGFFARLSRRRLKRGVFRCRPPGRHQPLPRRDQRRTEALHMDRRPRQNHRRRQTRAPSVNSHPLAYLHLFAPKLIVLDEPDSHLHPNNQRLLCSLLTTIAWERDVQVIMTTHSRHVLDSMYNDARILWVQEGQVVKATAEDQVDILLESAPWTWRRKSRLANSRPLY